MPYPHFAAMRDTNQTLDGLFAWTRTPRVSLLVQGQEDIGASTRVSGDYYRTLGLRPALGRLLTADDDHPGSAAAVISHGYWQRRFAGSPAVIGAAISLNQVPFTIVGVEPRGFAGINVGASSDVIIPLRAGERLEGRRSDWNDAFSTWIEIMGRVRPGIPIEQAAEDLKLHLCPGQRVGRPGCARRRVRCARRAGGPPVRRARSVGRREPAPARSTSAGCWSC